MIRTRLKEISLGMLLPYTFCKYQIHTRSGEIVGTSSTENLRQSEFFDSSSLMNSLVGKVSDDSRKNCC
jgi:hypothetical protein